ncbi:hypothetical protein IQ03_02559 [Gemmobacter caeni]|jgi:hypothetical protein|uniref:DUF1178 family protein n=2 Tax=Gemmobacter TaxID=204456 RepID=A0A2T6AYU1_9RHOB|nr:MULTISPECIES: DUF1178 family protein [Gemmobacter]OJY35175.1 MAG: hypothetical protein BGP11_00435 [Rhodobacterales bacterium 65-51]PTX48969.1 hypothetical protein C8N34_10875 [Gemmobacter caeni]TWI99030.1 hypothetical protein IQ03_02559 [Gemmobacter caeni]GHC31782.1 hypothetical protein GCM10007291_35880 [Gemmobacter nanjingensis]
MIRYSLHCAEGHDFESWFASATAFDDLKARGLVSCALCGGNRVEKALMAPAVAAKAAEPAARPDLKAPASEIETALAALRREVEANSEYVGMNFVSEARRMHAGDSPERAIHGEARPDEARKLIEEGVPVAPLPFLPVRKAN